MECVVQLQQSGGINILTENVPLKLTLCYEDKSIVANQSFLSISQDIEKFQIKNGTFSVKIFIPPLCWS
jgi:hypothetical protein